MDKHVGMYFKKISEKLEKKANENLGKRELTFSQGKVLWYLRKNSEKTVTLSDIAKFLDCTHATVSGLVSRLEKKGYLRIETDQSDHRAKNLFLTEKEMTKFRAMQEHRKQMEETLLQGFDEKERNELLSYLQRVYENLYKTV